MQIISWIEYISIILYAAAFVFAWFKLSNESALPNAVYAILGIAMVLHGYLSYQLIDGGEGQNLSLLNVFTMTTWIAMLLTVWNVIRHQAGSLLIVTLPIVISGLIAVTFLNQQKILNIDHSVSLLHILFGILAMSLMLLVAIQSVLVLYLDKGLRSKPAKIYPWLGSLESMERFLVQLVTLGFTFVTCSLVFVIWLPDDLKSAQVLHKIVLTIASWLVLGYVMYGRFVKGWRGVSAAKISLLGVLLLLVGYFGSKLVMEYILANG
ncbi:MAG: cytochrome c biogenesis protein CcsA [Gammaproteobacteria bacterium]|nr:cytochrome c biogenesis protein CcsA [Gammaproteobacteria bacterium]MDH5628886.1 cytochrome c biogenesis protein CcsA [Gammaproteobacteria bacterium]